MIQITKTTSKTVKKNIINRISDVPGGVSLVLSTLIPGNVIPEGTPISAPASGLRTICKQAKALTGSSTTVKKVTNGAHNFKVGDFLCTKEGGLAYAITTITTSNGVDDITVGTAIEASAAGDYLYEAAAQSASTTSAFKNIPNTILKEAFEVPAASSQVIMVKDAYVRADVVEDCIGAAYLAYLPQIAVIKY